MKMLVASVMFALVCPFAHATHIISSLSGSTSTNQWEYLGTNNEWFSRFDSQITVAQLQAFKNQPTSNLDLYAASTKIKVTYVGTGATRDSNLFLAGTGSFSTSPFWNPIYASGGSNNLSTYNPVNSSNQLFETRAGCTYQQAKNGNTCLASEIGRTREISGLTEGEELVFGLQTLPLVYDGINLPNVNYFFAGAADNNIDTKGWNDRNAHAKLLDLGNGKYLVGFEDTWLGTGSTSDRDYNDMVFIFEGVTNKVPEPGNLALLLGGLGLLGITLKRSHS